MRCALSESWEIEMRIAQPSGARKMLHLKQWIFDDGLMLICSMNASRNSASYAIEGGTFTKVVEDVDRGKLYFQQLWDRAVELPAEAFEAPSSSSRRVEDEVAAARASSLRPDLSCAAEAMSPQLNRGKGCKSMNTRPRDRGSSRRKGGYVADGRPM